MGQLHWHLYILTESDVMSVFGVHYGKFLIKRSISHNNEAIDYQCTKNDQNGNAFHLQTWLFILYILCTL